MSPISLSAVIITFNEERNIGRCIDSLRSVADEIIVVDSLSTDNTLKIAKTKSAKVTQTTWQGYSQTKNIANDLATGDFILSIDADEELSPELIDSILKFKANPATDVCEVNRLTNYCGQWIRHSGWYPEYKLRIFRKGIAEWKGDLHETLNFKKKYSSAKLDGDLLHYSYPTIESHLKKTLSYAAISANQTFREGKNYNLILHGILKPFFAFIRKYFFQGGFLDGYYGLVIAIITSFFYFLRYVNFRELKK